MAGSFARACRHNSAHAAAPSGSRVIGQVVLRTRLPEAQLGVVECIDPHRIRRQHHAHLTNRFVPVREHGRKVHRRHVLEDQLLGRIGVVHALRAHDPRLIAARGVTDVAINPVLPFKFVPVAVPGQIGRRLPRMKSRLPHHIGHVHAATIKPRHHAQVKAQPAVRIGDSPRSCRRVPMGAFMPQPTDSNKSGAKGWGGAAQAASANSASNCVNRWALPSSWANWPIQWRRYWRSTWPCLRASTPRMSSMSRGRPAKSL